jgi:Ser-tRNA(Ala) deacylase AlaX
LGNTLKTKCEREVDIYLMGVKSAQDIMLQKYKTKLQALQMRGGVIDEKAVVDFVASVAGRQEWDAMTAEIKKRTANFISKIADWGYLAEVAK